MLKLRNRKQCLIVAEISANHGQDFRRAVAMIHRAKACGADAVKFQAYTPESLTLDSDRACFRVKHPKWGGQTLYELYRKAYTPWRWFQRLKKVADDDGLVFLCTAFDNASVDLLESINVPAHKIASFELVDLPLIECAAATGKPLILSTGMATRAEIARAVAAARKAGAADVTLLKCVSCYPAAADEMNLRGMAVLAEAFDCPVGLSDHSRPPEAAIAAVTLGAVLVEKHFTLTRRTRTPDAFFSITPTELSSLVRTIRITEQALGTAVLGPTKSEKNSLAFRRSLFAVEDIAAGEHFTPANVRSIRPADGLEPRHFKGIMGRKARRRIARGTPLRWDMIF